MFSDGKIKNRILHGNENTFLQNYLVSVQIDKINEDIKSYTILELKDSYIDEKSETDLFS
jgi:hypothetical protein